MADNGDQSKPQGDAPEERQKSLKRSWRSSGPVAELTVVFAGIAALSTSIYAIVAWGQLTKMRDQLNVMSQTLALERPWLGLSGAVTSTFGPKVPPEATAIDWRSNRFVGMKLRVQNGGRTPATKVRFHANFITGITYEASQEKPTGVLPADAICDQGQLGPEYGAGVIMPAPTVPTEIPIYPGNDVLTKFDDIVNRKIGAYVVGCFDYSDSSGLPWYRTRVRLIFAPNDPERFSVARFGNEAW
jgi:hypothetical protein